MVDATDLKSVDLTVVPVRVRPAALFQFYAGATGRCPAATVTRLREDLIEDVRQDAAGIEVVDFGGSIEADLERDL